MSRLHLPLERSFVALVVIVGAFILFMASTLIQNTQYEFSRHYEATRRGFVWTHTGKVLGRTIDYLAKRVNQTDHPVVKDPLWMTQENYPVRRFMSSKTHPFLKDNVIENPDVCHNTSVDVLIVIHSAVRNFQRRRILRETWAASGTFEGISVKRVFALGRDGSNKDSQLYVNTEQASFRDIVQGNFEDTFRNLTRKAATMLRWINDHCLHARFILKTDDDVFVNVFKLAETYLQKLADDGYSVLCSAKPNNTSIIVRNPQSKWYVPSSLLPNKTHWPAFCSGFVVALTPRVVPELYRASFVVPLVPVDDAYVYGLLPLVIRDFSLHHQDISSHLMLEDGKLLSLYRDPLTPYVAGTAKSDEAVVKLWQATRAILSPWARQRAFIAQLHINSVLPDS